MIHKILRTNGKPILLDSFLDMNGNFVKEIPNHAYVYFTCEVCGKEDKKQKRRFESPPLFLCRECRKKHTLQEKYGVSHQSQAEEVKKKIGEASKRNNNINRMKDYLEEEYGVRNASKIPKFVEKRQNTKRENILFILEQKLEQYNLKPLFNIENYIGQRIEDRNIFYDFLCLKCNTLFKGTLNGHFPTCPNCNQKGSKPENEIVEFIKEIYSGTIIQNTKNILPDKLELDIYLPDRNMAIEFNGLYWHSQKDKNYHLKKTVESKRKGIKLIHIFEDEWRNKKDIVKNIIRFQLGLVKKTFARNTTFYEVSSNEVKEFFEKYHIQGFAPSSYYFALYNKGEIVSALSIQKSRYNSNYDWEIARVAYKYHVVGALSKLIKNFRKLYNGSIITYSDRRFFTGNSYKKIGFQYLHETPINYFYTDGFRRFSRNMFQKHKLSKQLEHFDESKTEKENMLENGYLIIYDCGNFAFILK